ncbi:hypothetical protein DUNSADRAFT_6576 [Dunaliella salina]|uniref:DUF7880 domain-containing protein n=1 Tax=Dunaliella salina TaxID=3046 RepID=A0ABQ7GN15_DUNSA|nr:hypothetical protein DUNSADRAFT_6576 [Dunaliella salina]|eukprot:KAF5836006.1 hypothetical protein DUNSADRAFT_6576 [Dunaliella salina]
MLAHPTHSGVCSTKARRCGTVSAGPRCIRSAALSGAGHQQQSEQQGSGAPLSSRRMLLLAAQALVAGLTLQERPAQAERGLAKYIKKKALDPLETYVPVILEAREQLLEAGEVMGTSPDLARQLLRSGPFGAVRENVRVLGEYAVINGQAEKAAPLVNGFFKALEDYDLNLRQTVKQQKDLDKEEAQRLLDRSVKALDDLLATVPEDTITKGRTILEVARKKSMAGLEEGKQFSEDVPDTIPLP